MHDQHETFAPARFLTMKDVSAMTGLHRATIYKLIAAERHRFPPPLRITDTARRWRESDVIDWLNARAAGVGRPARETTRPSA